MSNYIIYNIEPFDSFKPYQSYLVLIAIDKTPPHLALLCNSLYYSLSSNGVKRGVDANIILNSINRKSIPSLFLPLSIMLNSEIVNLEYSNYNQLDQGQSCLTPIKNILGTFNKNLLNCKYAFDLIPLLYSMKIIDGAKGLNYAHSSLELVSYGQEEIDLAIYNAAQLC